MSLPFFYGFFNALSFKLALMPRDPLLLEQLQTEVLPALSMANVRLLLRAVMPLREHAKPGEVVPSVDVTGFWINEKTFQDLRRAYVFGGFQPQYIVV